MIVDDEEMVLASLRSFLELETEYNIQSFTSPDAALAYAENGSVDVVVSDFLMPQLNGIELLGRFSEHASPRAPHPADRLRRQGKRHQGHQRHRAFPVHRKALGQFAIF